MRAGNLEGIHVDSPAAVVVVVVSIDIFRRRSLVVGSSSLSVILGACGK